MGRGRVVDDLRARRIASLARRPPVIDHPTPTPSHAKGPAYEGAPRVIHQLSRLFR